MLIMGEKSQHDKFKEAARELECDEDEARLDANIKKLAKSGEKKPEKKPEKKD